MDFCEKWCKGTSIHPQDSFWPKSAHKSFAENVSFLINIQSLSFPITSRLVFSATSLLPPQFCSSHSRWAAVAVLRPELALERSRVYVRCGYHNKTEHLFIRAGLKLHHLNFRRSSTWMLSMLLPTRPEMYRYQAWQFKHIHTEFGQI